MITKQMLIDVGVDQETIDLLDVYPTAFRQLKVRLRKAKGETWVHWFKWQLLWLFRIYEFKADCKCGQKLRCTDGVKEYKYQCVKCNTVYAGTKKRVFT